MNIKLKTKLIGGFLFVALTTLAVGANGIRALSGVRANLNEIVDNRAPSVQTLLQMQDALDKLLVSQRSMLIPGLPDEDFKRQVSNVDKTRKQYDDALAIYEPLPQVPEEARIWQAFVPLRQQWREENEVIFKVAQDWRETDIIDPERLVADLRKFEAEHLRLNEKSLQALDNGEQTDETSRPCGLSSWLKTFSTKNAIVQQGIADVRKQDERYHNSVHEFSRYLREGDRDAARKIFHGSAEEGFDGLLNGMRQMEAEAERAAELQDKAVEHAMGPALQKHQQLMPLLEQLLEINLRLGKEEGIKAEQNGSRASNLSLIGMLAGFVIAVGLGVFIAFSITRPIASITAASQFLATQNAEMARAASAIANGDLTAELKSAADDETLKAARSAYGAKDEIGMLNEAFLEMSEHQRAVASAMTQMSNNLNEVLGRINDTAQQVSSGAAQVSDASQSLSQGATEQAASLEEISSSITEIGSQTKTNADNAAQANRLATSARTAADNGTNQVQQMMAAMNEIQASSREIVKIVKVIDDIAFQTNLLALNAAVEAARAGRHGKGFAVVAEEVRNLAARSAKAARETAEGISSSMEKVENGTKVAARTVDALTQIAGEVSKVNDLVNEIAAASNEQAQAVSQVSTGMGQIDGVTQQNTASAEETASAAQELSGQASELRQLLSRFRLRNFGAHAAAPSAARPLDNAPRQGNGKSNGKTNGNTGWGKNTRKQQTPKPEEVISLESADFGRF